MTRPVAVRLPPRTNRNSAEHRRQLADHAVQLSDWSQVLPRSVSVDTSLTTRDLMVLVDATAAARTVTLPAVEIAAPVVYRVKKTDASANAVTVATVGSETIDGAATKALASQYETLSVVSDGANWWIV